MLIVARGVLDHDDGVGAVGNGGSGHDLGTLTRRESDAGDVHAGLDFGDVVEASGNGGDVGGTNGEAVAGERGKGGRSRSATMG